MALPEVVSRDEWLAARKALLAREKEATRARDALNADRRRLPMVRVEQKYVFEGPDGQVGLAELFGGRRQLIVQHVMFHADWEKACPSCTAGVDEISHGLIDHLHNRETEFALVSRAPYEKLAAYAAERGWFVPWYSSQGSDFNLDYGVTIDPLAGQIEYNYTPQKDLVAPGETSEQPGVSVFLKEGEEIFHTYSSYARGVEYLGSTYALLDVTALGRQELWEEPKGRYQRAREAVPSFEE
ncbi:MAG TPA: DUF899 domain-containing protein [Actinospica sp.]|nr:DUF899 domain-containing protein [Actinospica sp.]